MKVIFWNREGNQKPVDFGVDIAARLPLDELLRQSDVLSLHCPLTDTTRGLLNREKLDLLPHEPFSSTRPGAEYSMNRRLWNCFTRERSAVSVWTSTRMNRIWIPSGLWQPRTVLLPHLGSATLETREAMAKLLCDGIAESLLS
jgi:glyoxylate reductase